MKNDPILTTDTGTPVSNDQASLTTGPKEGYTLLQDTHLIEKLAHFDRERIPERVVHAKGAGAHGYFEVTHDVSRHTCADFLSQIGKKTDVFVRFSTVGGEKGSADSARDPRGFAVKFYTREGNYDMVGNNTPIFFIRDAMKFPDFIHTQKRNPETNLKDANMFWDFLSLTPESLHQVMILFSDRGTPATYRNMDGHSSHTFMWYNEKKEYVWIKLHFKTRQGWKTLSADEAGKLSGTDPDHATRDLFEAIEKGEYPEWDVFVQIMTPEQAREYKYDPFDVTKVWLHGDFPLIPVGKMVLDKNPVNYFAEVEQSAFAPSNFVPGIGPSPDKLLQGRLFSYRDTQRWRLGVNHAQIPINASKNACPHHYERDGAANVDGNGGNAPNYYPNTMRGPEPSAAFAPPVMEVQAVIDKHTRPTEEIDFEQPALLYAKVMNDRDRSHLISNIAGHLQNARQNLQYRQTALFYKCNADLGIRLARALNLDEERVSLLAGYNQTERIKNTL